MYTAMVVMPANNSGLEFRELHSRFPGRLAWIISPGGFRTPPEGLRVHLDNAAFSHWIKGTPWCGLRFSMFLQSIRARGITPGWVVCPDVVGEKEATLKSWDQWSVRLKDEYGWPMAFAVQNGMTADDVPLSPTPDVIFVGGTTHWKWSTLRHWCENFPRVHVGRVNSRRQLLLAHMRGAESCDGSGWFRGDRAQLAGLVRFLEETTPGYEHQKTDLELV